VTNKYTEDEGLTQEEIYALGQDAQELVFIILTPAGKVTNLLSSLISLKIIDQIKRLSTIQQISRRTTVSSRRCRDCILKKQYKLLLY
jgi:hypothetical protein